MSEYIPIKPLLYWLDNSQNKINQILQKGKRTPDKKLIIFFPLADSIKFDISQRDSCFELYKHLIDIDSNDLSSEIQINKRKFKYHEIRHQLFIPMLSLNTRIYEKCVKLCYYLNNPQRQPTFYRLSEVFSNEFSKKASLNNDHINIIKKLSYDFGYCFSIILFFRNQFLHSGQYSTIGESFFISDKKTDLLNLEVVKAEYKEYEDKYIKIQLSKKHFDLKDLIDNKGGKIIKKCMYFSDHYFGCLVNQAVIQIMKKEM